MIRSLYSGVAGMKNHQLKMDVVGNNISNVNTSGYKSSRANFKDTLYQSIKSPGLLTNPAQAGLGMTVSSITSTMTQGGLQATSRDLDLAINGNGFFKVTDGVKDYYTRDGIFYIAQDGSLVNSSGLKLVGQLSEAARVESEPLEEIGEELKPAVFEAGEFGDITNLVLGDISATYETENFILSEDQELKVSIFINADNTDEKKAVSFSIDGGKTWGEAKATFSDSESPTEITGIEFKFKHDSEDVTVKLKDLNGSDGISIENGDNQGLSFEFVIVNDDDGDPSKVEIVDGSIKSPELGDPSPSILSNYQGLKDGDDFEVNVFKDASGKVYYDIGEGWEELKGKTVDLTDDGKAIDINASSMERCKAYTIGVKGIELQIRGTNADGTEGIEQSMLVNPSDDYLTSIIDGVNRLANQTGVVASKSDGRLVLSAVDQTENGTMSIGGSAAELLGLDAGSFSEAREMSSPAEIKLNLPAGVSIDNLVIMPDGRIVGTDSLGNPLEWSADGHNITQILVFNFPNQDGLLRAGENLFQESPSSGRCLEPGVPGSPGFGTIESGYLEMSNVDLTDEFSTMITTQRGYQANSRVITVSDTMLEELINLKR